MSNKKWKKFDLPVTQAKVECVCGQIVNFKRNFPSICRSCGRTVYPTKKSEFLNKMKRKGVMIYK